MATKKRKSTPRTRAKPIGPHSRRRCAAGIAWPPPRWHCHLHAAQSPQRCTRQSHRGVDSVPRPHGRTRRLGRASRRRRRRHVDHHSFCRPDAQPALAAPGGYRRCSSWPTSPVRPCSPNQHPKRPAASSAARWPERSNDSFGGTVRGPPYPSPSSSASSSSRIGFSLMPASRPGIASRTGGTATAIAASGP